MQEIASAQERRLIFKLLKHWRDARGGEFYPSLVEFRARLDADLSARTFELAVGEPGEEPRFRAAGEILQAAFDEPLSGKAVSSLPACCLLAHAVRQWRQVLRRGLPISLGGSFVDAGGQDVLYRNILMPASADGVRIDTLVGCISGKVPDVRPEIGAASLVDPVASGMAGEWLR